METNLVGVIVVVKGTDGKVEIFLSERDPRVAPGGKVNGGTSCADVLGPGASHVIDNNIGVDARTLQVLVSIKVAH